MSRYDPHYFDLILYNVEVLFVSIFIGHTRTRLELNLHLFPILKKTPLQLLVI